MSEPEAAGRMSEILPHPRGGFVEKLGDLVIRWSDSPRFDTESTFKLGESVRIKFNDQGLLTMQSGTPVDGWLVWIGILLDDTHPFKIIHPGNYAPRGYTIGSLVKIPH